MPGVRGLRNRKRKRRGRDVPGVGAVNSGMRRGDQSTDELISSASAVHLLVASGTGGPGAVRHRRGALRLPTRWRPWRRRISAAGDGKRRRWRWRGAARALEPDSAHRGEEVVVVHVRCTAARSDRGGEAAEGRRGDATEGRRGEGGRERG